MVTTIGKGEFLADYFAALTEENAIEQVEFIIIPDRKSPPELYAQCQQYSSKGMRISCPTLEVQDAYLDKLGIKELIPYNSDNRRNVGYLMALESGRDFCISIDDDNFARPASKFFAEHSIVAKGAAQSPTVNSADGWFNICKLLDMQPANVYPRGYPYSKRHTTPEISEAIQPATIRINAGLWLGEPDLDAMTWLVSPARAKALRGKSVVLGDSAWSPINTQNTSLHRDVLVSYYFVKMGYPLGGLMTLDRYGDIFSGYLAQACLRHLGDRIRVGTPAVDHRRNSHNYMKDATCEMGCVLLIEDFTAWLTEVKLSGSNYRDAYLSLANAIDDQAERFSGFIWNESTSGYMHQLAHCMKRWTSACQRWL